LGAGILSTFIDSATILVEFPFGSVISEKLTIHIKRAPQELSGEDEINFKSPTISQISGTFQVLYSSSSDIEETLEIYSYSGKLIKSIKVMGQQKIDLEDLPVGVYIIHASIDGNQIVGRFIRH